MPLQRRDKNGDERLEPLPADPVGGFPENDQCFAHRVVVHRYTRPSTAAPVSDGLRGEQPHAVLAVVARHRDELIEDSDALLFRADGVPLAYRSEQVVSS